VTTEAFHVTRWGETGPRVILVHGSAQGSRAGGDQHFSRQRQLAERGFQVLVPDRPGHGRSADPGRPDDAEADGALVADLIGDGAHLVGHSYGGCVALAAAVRNPSAVRSLTLIEPAMPLLAMHRLAVLRFGIRVALVTAMPMSDVSRVKRFVKLVNIPPELRGTDGASDAELSKMGRALARMKLPSKGTLRGQLTRIRDAGVPVLAVAGTWSPAFRAITDTVASIAGGKTLVIQADHHFVHLVSDELNDALVRFMQESDARRGGRA
jgi:pimeloyl-ACP methyl ester carboxylesterase